MRWLIRLYPRAWRERYEDEMLAVLEQHRITPSTVVDLLIGALDANLHYGELTEDVTHMVNRLRTGVVTIFCAYMLFGVGWGMLQRFNDPLYLFDAVAIHHPELRVLYEADFIAGCLSFLAFLTGGLPLLVISVRRAVQKRDADVLVPFGLALACTLMSILATAILAIWHPNQHVYVFLGIYVALIGVMLVVGTAAVSLVIQRTDFHLSELRFVYIPAVAILFCMGAAVVVSVILIIETILHAPQLLNTQDVNSPMFITGLFCMALGAVFAAIGIRGGGMSLASRSQDAQW